MTLADDMKMRLQYLGLSPADAEACMQYVKAAAVSHIFLAECFDEQCWEQDIGCFEIQKRNTLFDTLVLREAFHWLTSRHYKE